LLDLLCGKGSFYSIVLDRYELPGIYSDPDYNYYEKYKDEIKVLNQATRGIFYSVNEIEMKK
jgi:hypothetical protein